MEGLSVAASIAGLVSLADTVFTRTYRYARCVRRATKEIDKLALGIRTLSSLLHSLRLLLTELEDEAVESNVMNLTEFRLHYVSSCLTTLTKIQKKLEKYHPEAAEQQGIRQAIRNLKWPFSEGETQDLINEVEKHKTAITVALSGDTLITVLKALSRQEDVAADLRDLKEHQNHRWALEDHIRLNEERRKIIAFFGKVDPSANHQMSLKLRHPLTGLWVTEGLQFRTWMLSRNSKLWLSGIPGAGKTVIAASVIEEVMKESSQDRAVAYFYCDHKDTEKQNPINILGSLASQLARQNENAFKMLEQLHQACHQKDKPAIAPELQVLVNTTREMASQFDDVSIIVDGLDECEMHTSRVIDALVSLASNKNSNTRTLFLSREEPEIRELLSREYNHMEIAAHSEDLRLYVAAEIATRQHKFGREKLRIKSAQLKEYMMKILVERADGMFRWVACQLDYLCSLPNDAEKREALGSLPPGLNATYERILDRVEICSESIQQMVQKTLQWTVSSATSIPAIALCHAISIKDGDRTLNEEAFYDEEDILMYCSSLLRRSADGKTLEIAHFTVKEFLSTIDPNSTHSRYSQKEKTIYPQLVVACLSYITLDCFSGSVVDSFDEWNKKLITEHPFRQHAVKYWFDYAENSWEDIRVLELGKKLFDHSATSCFLSWARDLAFFSNDDGETFLDDQKGFSDITRYFCAGGLEPLHMAAALGLPEICQWLIESGCDVNHRSNVGTPLHCVLLGADSLLESPFHSFLASDVQPFEFCTEPGKRLQVLEILIANGADFNISYRDRVGEEFSCNYLAFYSDIGCGANHPLIKLVAAGARLEDQLLKLLDTHLEQVLEEEQFVEALLSQLKESNQDYPIRLQAALKFNSSTGVDLLKSYATGLTHSNIQWLIDIFRSMVRFDQTQGIEALLRHEGVNLLSQYSELGTTFLHDAADWKSVGAVRLLLSVREVDVNATNKEGLTPLHIAVCGSYENERYQQCISLLLDHGADVNAIDNDGETVWHTAARCDNSEVAMRLLLKSNKNDIQGLDIVDNKGLIPLFAAAKMSHMSTCELLVSHNSYAHRRCPAGLNLVHYAVRMNAINILRALQEKNFAVSEKTLDGRTGLHFLTSKSTMDVVHLLIDSGINIGAQALNGETPLHNIAQMWPKPEIDVFEDLFDTFAQEESINSSTMRGLTPLHYALFPPIQLEIYDNKYDLSSHAEALITKGADIHMRLPNGVSCLSNLVVEHEKDMKRKQEELDREKRNGNNHGVRTIEAALRTNRIRMQTLSKLVIGCTNHLEMLTELIDLGTLRVRPINWFMFFGAQELIDLLLDKSVDIDLSNAGTGMFSSWSAVNYACWFSCSIDIVRKLFKRSNRLYKHDAKGHYLIHTMCLAGSIASSPVLEELCKAGLDLDLATANQAMETPLMLAARNGKQEHVQILLDYGANIHVKGPDGQLAMHWAAANGHIAIIESFLGLGDDWNCCTDGSGRNILHLAALEGQDGCVDFIVQRSLIEDLNSLSTDQNSALALAVLKGDYKTVAILLKAGANVNVLGRHGIRPIHVAARLGNLRVIRKLVEHKCSLEAGVYGITPQMIALMHGHQMVISFFKECQEQKDASNIRNHHSGLKAVAANAKSSNHLRDAITREDLKLCKALIADGFSLDREFSCGCLPLLYALCYDNDEITRYLLVKGASMRGRLCTKERTGGYSAIHLACTWGKNADILKILLARDPTAVSLAFKCPVSPLHVAVGFENIAALELMLQYWKHECLGGPGDHFETDGFANSRFGPVQLQKKRMHGGKQQLKKRLLSIYNAQIETLKLETPWVLSGNKNNAVVLDTDNIDAGTPLHLAAHLGRNEAAKILISYGASTESIDDLGNTPLSVACWSGETSTARYLLESGANPSHRNYNGSTPAMLATVAGKTQILDLLLDTHADPTLTNGAGSNLLHFAVNGGPEVFSYLLMRGYCPYAEDHSKDPPVMEALLNYSKFPTYIPLIFNLDLNFDKLRKVLLHPRVLWKNSCKTMVKLFLKRAPSNVTHNILKATTWTNGSVLGDAAKDGQVHIVELFVRAGANLELDCGAYGTPLISACLFGHLPVVKYLVRSGAKMITNGARTLSAIEASRSFPSIIRWLLVEQHTEQPRIGHSLSENEPREEYFWSGVKCVKVETAGLYSPIFDSSSIDHARELAKLRRGLQGNVVHVLEDFDEDQIQEHNYNQIGECVRVCPWEFQGSKNGYSSRTK